MATTMNPVDLYHDPSLDGMLPQSAASTKKNPSSARRSSNGHRRTASDSLEHSAALPPSAPEVPHGPPISYRGFGATDPGLNRSFSQRVKGRPFPKEAFLDQEPETTITHPTPLSSQPDRQQDDRTQVTRRKPVPEDSLRLKTTNLNGNPDENPSRQKAEAAPGVLPASAHSTTTSRRNGDSSRVLDEPASAISRSSAFQHDSHRRDWAPDRSPLQKLEVTLNDISKEEKRARVQEAEMLLREKNANRGAIPAEPSKRVPSSTDPNLAATKTRRRSSSKRDYSIDNEPSSLQDAGLVRNLSTTQRQRLQHSTTVDNHRPDARRLSGEKHPGFEYTISAPLYKEEPPVRRESRKHRTQASSDHPPSRAPPMAAERAIQNAALTKSGDHRGSSPLGPELPHPDDLPVKQPKSEHIPEPQAPRAFAAREIGERGMNASHKAALAKLTGTSAPVERSNSRKLQKPRPSGAMPTRDRAANPASRIPVPVATLPAAAATAAMSTAINRGPDPRLDSRVQNPPHTPPTGLGLHPSPHPSSPRSPPEKIIDVTRQRQRKSSVSFKEPMKRRPTDEWKEAETARLTASDFSTSAPAPTDKAQTWWEQNPGSTSRRRSRSNKTSDQVGFDASIDDRSAEFKPRLFLRCGPLLRYTGMKRSKAEDGKPDREFWRGSVLIVTQDSHSSYDSPPILRLFSRPKKLLPPPPQQINGDELHPEYVDPIAGLTKLSRTGRVLYVRPVDHLEEGRDLSQVENDDGLFESSPSPLDHGGGQSSATTASTNRYLDNDGERLGRYQEVRGARLYADPDRDVTFWRFNLEIELGDAQQHVAYRINSGPSVGFWVPGRGETMNIMFHSCNGFSLSVNPDNFSGPDPMWRDVLNTHQTRPFHVMIGGGDQIYNDRVVLETQHFGAWTRMRNPNHKHHALFTNDMKEELESFYLNRYAMWFSQGLFGMAASQIPMINIWDDHDIIDGFGSYPNHFMETPVFSGLGNVAFKYYMLFQHQSVPEETTVHEPSWLLGHEPGPFIKQLSRSVFMNLGKHVAFLGLDCRTERMRGEVLSVDTIEIVLERCRKELIEGETKHLLLLLGVPIAYPRLVWLENVLTSRLMDPVKALGRAGVIKGGFLNKFDGGVEILDDLDDHWTSTNHKRERNDLVKDLQDLAAEKSCRITILSGDVHLGAIGQFHSNPKLKIPKDRDHRYMPNIISSAIVNTPPSDMLADILNKRNKTHHLDRYTDENMIPMFTHDVDSKKRNNRHMLPRRNWCSIREYVPGSTPPPSPPETPDASDISGDEEEFEHSQDLHTRPRRFSFTKDDVNPRNLFRRLSSRKAPPNSYRDMMYEQGRSASHDGTSQPRDLANPLNRNVSGSRQSSAEFQSDPGRRAASFDYRPAAPPMRPGMFPRRPTNLSEKAARKGNIPAIDAEGNEIDVNDSINLAGGLDVVLNMEISQKDPSGITMPYRLLVPALWYDGSSDREKLEEASGVQRRPTLLDRFGFPGRRSHKAARTEGEGNWGQADSEESYSEDEDHRPPAAQPRRRFSLFGSRRQRDDHPQTESESDEERDTHTGGPGSSAPQWQAGSNHGEGAIARPSKEPEYQMSHNVTGPVNHDMLYDTQTRPPPTHSLDPRSHQSTRRSLNNPSGSKQAPELFRGDNAARIVSDSHTNPYPQSSYPVATSSLGQALPLGRQGVADKGSLRTDSGNFHTPSPPSAPVGSGGTFPQRRLSKQERILGISSSDPVPQAPPHQLRGNGIIGKDFDGEHGYQGYRADGPPPQGYSGIEAWKEPKPRRGFSLRKARDWLDGRGNRGDRDEFD